MKTLQFEISEGVGTLVLNRPQRKNAIDLDMRRELREVLVEHCRKPELRCLIITGAGGAFCAGGDIGSMEAREPSAEGGRKRMRDTHSFVTTLLTLEIPVIAAVDGVAYGAGFNLALAADFILATPRARFCQSFGRIGLVPDLGGLYTLPRWVGVPKAKELVFSARELSAEEARSLGIVYGLHEEAELLPAAHELAGRFVHASPTALALAKNILNSALQASLESVLQDEAMAQGICFETEFHREAARRFQAKETPLFLWPQGESPGKPT